MPDTRTKPTLLDWTDLIAPPERHVCDCGYCDMVDEFEPQAWSTLVTVERDGAAYVTDRYMMIRAERAPIPADYQGSVLAGPTDLGAGWSEPVTDQAPEGLWFYDGAQRMVAQTGWRLVQLDHPEGASSASRKRVGIVDADGEHIGWAIGTPLREDS